MLSDILVYVRRLLKQPNPEDISDDTIINYVNRFYIYDMPSRIQLFQLKTQYSLELEPNVDRYAAPVTYLPGGQAVPTYNSFLTPAFVDGYQIGMQQSTAQFTKLFPNLYQNGFQSVGDGTSGPYTLAVANSPFIRGFRDQNIQNTTIAGGVQTAGVGILSSAVWVTAQDASGNNLVVQDDGDGNLVGDGTGTVNYLTGSISVTFSANIPATSDINSQVIPYTAGRPQALNFFDETFTFRPVPDKPYLFQIDAYLNPAYFLSTTDAMPYNWMTEYIARGTTRKILIDYGDAEQLSFQEPYFREQENLVLRRSTRQNSNVRTATIFMGQTTLNPGTYNQI
jgi:hypothetical protein